MIFFALSVVVGGMILAKGHLMKLLIKQFLTVMMVVSAVLNFAIIDGEPVKYEKLGGYISWPIIYALQEIFNNTLAVKVFIILMLLGCVAWILWTFNVSLPKIHINLKEDDKPKHVPQKQQTADIAKKISKISHDEEDHHNEPQTISPSFISTIIKKQAQEKIAEKEFEKKHKAPINFSGEKPTFMTNILESNGNQTMSIDEEFLMEKAKSLQSKLLEFNVPIIIEGFDIGPSIVQIRIKPESGIKIATIEGLVNDIALSLKSKSLRIVAPIPGTDCVGIQLPNPKPMMVRLGDVI